MHQKEPLRTTLSATTLLVGSLSSAATAVVVHEFWKAGAILGAAVTPVLVALFSELLSRPITRVQTQSMSLRAPRPVRVAPTTSSGVPVRVYRSRPRWGLALATGAAAFVIGATGLTATELLLDRSVADRDGRTTLLDSGPPSQPGGPLEAGAAAAASERDDVDERGRTDRRTRERDERRDERVASDRRTRRHAERRPADDAERAPATTTPTATTPATTTPAPAPPDGRSDPADGTATTPAPSAPAEG